MTDLQFLMALIVNVAGLAFVAGGLFSKVKSNERWLEGVAEEIKSITKRVVQNEKDLYAVMQHCRDCKTPPNRQHD